MKAMITAVFIFALGAIEAQQPTVFDVFYGSEVCDMRLSYDFRQLEKQTADEKYQDACLEWFRGGRDTIRFEIELKARGNMRKGHCDLPPLRFKFSKDNYDHHKIKLVHCCRDDDNFEDYLLGEYIAYRMMNVLTDTSFRVQLLRITYHDIGGNEKDFTRFAFLLEHKDQLAERLGVRIHEFPLVSEGKLRRSQLNLVTFFEYMIANTDWATKTKHNLEILIDTTNSELIAVPYDFDYSGFVQTPYAVPQDEAPIPHVSVRFNRGYCMEKEDAALLRQKFLTLQGEIMELCENLPGLSEKYRKRRCRYMSKFFNWLENPRRVEDIFCYQCTTMIR